MADLLLIHNGGKPYHILTVWIWLVEQIFLRNDKNNLIAVNGHEFCAESNSAGFLIDDCVGKRQELITCDQLIDDSVHRASVQIPSDNMIVSFDDDAYGDFADLVRIKVQDRVSG